MKEAVKETITKLIKDAKQLATEVEAYENKPTKACSKRIRKLTLAVGKPEIRKVLIEADKQGY